MKSKLFVEVKTREMLDQALNAGGIMSPDSLIFVREDGKEGLNINNKDYQTIPSGGKDGQVLMSSAGKGVWTDLNLIDLISYGVTWDTDASDPVITRIGNMSLHRTLPIQSGMRGCVITPFNYNMSQKQVVVYWLDPNDWRYVDNSEHPLTERAIYNPSLSEQNDGTFIMTADFLDNGNYESNLLAHRFKAYGTYLRYVNGSNRRLYQVTKVVGETDTTNSGSTWKRVSIEVKEIKNETILPNDIDWGIANTTVFVESNLAGFDGEVMVYIPEFYIHSVDGPKIKEVRISEYPIEGWEYQPAIFMSPYYNTLLRESPPDNMGYLSGIPTDTLVSVANDQPYCRGGANGGYYDTSDDIYRRNLGKGLSTVNHRQVNEKTLRKITLPYKYYKNCIYWLYVIEYANFNAQAPYNPELTTDGFRQGGLGMGITNIKSDFCNYYNSFEPLCPCGYTNEFGNGTGTKELILKGFTFAQDNKTFEDIKTDAIRWRGIENPFGDSFIILEGIVVKQINIDGKTVAEAYRIEPGYIAESLSNLNNLVGAHKATFIGNVSTRSGSVKEFRLGETAEIIPISVSDSYLIGKCDDYNLYVSSKDSITYFNINGRCDSTNMAGLSRIISLSSYETIMGSCSCRTVYDPTFIGLAS